jgi:hypothetical protein
MNIAPAAILVRCASLKDRPFSMNKTYNIFLDQKKIGTTELEKADVPMGVLFGQIHLLDIQDGYNFFKDYCVKNIIGVTKYPDERIISTRHIPNFQVIDCDKTEIKGIAISVAGQGNDDFEITIEGIPHLLFISKFGHHIAKYKELTKQNISKDNIKEIGIDTLERLYINPEKEKFSLIYRTVTEVHWDEKGSFLYSPKPKEWTYFDWYKQIVGVVESECNCKLLLTDNTQWSNIPAQLKRQICNWK